jgi:hypothetical protein
MNKSLIKEAITKLINEVYGFDNLTEHASISDLKGVSEDNEEFLTKFKKQFNVNMDGFRYYDYFHEDQFIIWNLVRNIFSGFGIKVKKKKLTIGHLVKVAERGKWFDPEEE